MKQIILTSILIFTFCLSVLPQKLSEPFLLGNLTYGDDPSEFLLHDVMERSQRFLEENPEGKLVVRICGTDDFSTSFVKATFSPLSASNYNELMKRILVPYEKIFIAKSSKCLGNSQVTFPQYWFFPDKITIENEEMFSIKEISYLTFNVWDYDFETSKKKTFQEQKKEFSANIKEFVEELKNDPKAEGFIVHNSKNVTIKRNIQEVKRILVKEKINSQRVKTFIQVSLTYGRGGKTFPIKDEKETFPSLQILTIKK